MFRIRKIWENNLTLILKIEGEISDSDLSIWAEEVGALTQEGTRQTVLDCCSVTSISPKALEVLSERLSGGIYVVNCPVWVKNILHSAGRSKNILD